MIFNEELVQRTRKKSEATDVVSTMHTSPAVAPKLVLPDLPTMSFGVSQMSFSAATVIRSVTGTPYHHLQNSMFNFYLITTMCMPSNTPFP